MKLLQLTIALSFLLLIGCNDGTPSQIQTRKGIIEGVELEGIKRFLGIPYAKAPVGHLRWAEPVPIDAWSGIKETKDFGPWCPQPDFDRRDEGTMLSGEGWTIFLDVPPNKNAHEDCLSLNVWAPAEASNHPVMVFIHGNALGSSFPVYDGEAFAKDGVVYVSFNFRLLTIGNFAHPAITKAAKPTDPLSRYTEMDQLAALRWVQQNIAVFGGNPNNVTIVGSSNGGAGILQMLSNKKAEGLFHKAIVQSGNGWWEPVNQTQNEQLGCKLASMAGLDGCNATAEELRNLPWQQLPVTGPYSIDGRTWKEGATQAIAAGNVIDVPLLIGWNDFDGSSLRYSPQQVIKNSHPSVLASYKKDSWDSEEDLAYALYTDLHSGAPARWVAHQMEQGEPVYLYLFSYVLSMERDKSRGAAHAYELPHVFDSLDKVTPPIIGSFLINDEDHAMSKIMHACWVSFIKQGKPTCPEAPEWPSYNRATDQLMELNLKPKVLAGFRSEQLNAQEKAMAHYLEKSKTGIEKFLYGGE